MTEIAQDRAWYPSYSLEGRFREYWGQQDSFFEEESMFSRYRTLCDEAMKIRKAPPEFNKWVTDATLTNQRWLYKTCLDLADVRYEREHLYVRALMVEKAILYQSQNLHSYISEYFSNTRLRGLLDKYVAMDGCFNMVLKYVRRTDCCNH
jgi:hypothetical protein